MKRTVLYLLFALLLINCGNQPQTLSELKSEYVTIDDSIRVHYKIWNELSGADAKTICFVHGFGCDMNTWEKQFEAFRDEKSLQLVLLDLPGYGQSDKPHVAYTLDFFAHAIDEVLNSNNIQDAVFVGHSLGTPVCRQMLMATGHKGALVDVDGVYCFYDGTETPEYVEAVNQFGHAFDGDNCREVITGFVSSLAGKDTPQDINDYAMSVMPETPQYVASSTMQHLIEKRWWPNRQITQPAMVICTQNSGLDPDNNQKMQRLYSNLDYTELTTCGHFIHMEQPDMFNKKLKAFIASQMPNMQAGDAQILFEIRPEVNYVTHLYTLAGLGFSDEEYAAKYGHTLPKAAVDTLQKYKDYLTFGQGEGGMLAGTFFFMVSAETFADADSLQKIMDKYQEMAKSYNSPADIMNIANAIAKVYVDNYDRYLRDVYPQAKKDMEERQNQLSQHMKDHSFVKDWERVTGYTWNRGDYHWLLYRAGAKGPSYNNLNENTNTVYYNQYLDYQLAMFSHEFGIFLMQDSIDPIVEEMKEYTRNPEQSSPTRSLSLNSKKDLTYVPWSAFESLACWYNCKIAGKETEDYRNFGNADVKSFCQIYDRLSATGITGPAELYRKGIMEYLKIIKLEQDE